MALQKTLKINTFGKDIEFQNSYIKVDQVISTKNISQVIVEAYDEKKENKIQNFYYKFIPNLDGDNFIKQAYLHLKTLPEFAGAVDC
jgi:hypothetical protein